MNKAVDVISSIVVVGGLFTLTRPGSQGPTLLKTFFSGFSGLLGTAEGVNVKYTATTSG